MAWAQVDEEQDDFFSCSDMSEVSRSDNEVMHRSGDTDEQVEADDSDIDAEVAQAHGPQTTSEKRRAQNELMRAFAANISAHVTQKEIQEVASKSAKEEQLSIRDILANQDTTIRITNPRDYQTELFQRAKTENIIAVLDTGSGKTHIATLLLRHVLDEELENRAKGSVHKIAFFIVSGCVNLYCLQPNQTYFRSTPSILSSSKRTYYVAGSTRTSRAFAAPWAPHCGGSQLGKSISQRTWSSYAQPRFFCSA